MHAICLSTDVTLLESQRQSEDTTRRFGSDGTGRAGGGMELIYAGLSSAGPVRANNEDNLEFWEPPIAEEWRTRGAAVILADGVGGHGNGEVASRLACEQARAVFAEAKPGLTP